MASAHYILPDGLPRPRLRGWLHFWAFVTAVGLGIALVLTADGAAVPAALIYACSVAGLFGASALYHRGRWSFEVRDWLKRIDHSMIFVLIAGTYTPMCVFVVPGTLGTAMLVVVWGGALFAIVSQLSPWEAPRWLDVALGLGLGWVAVFAAPAIVDAL